MIDQEKIMSAAAKPLACALARDDFDTVEEIVDVVALILEALDGDDESAIREPVITLTRIMNREVRILWGGRKPSAN